MSFFRAAARRVVDDTFAFLAVHRGLLTALTLVLATAHLYMAGMYAIDRATPSVRLDGLDWVTLVGWVSSRWWITAQLTAATALTAGVLLRSRYPSVAMYACSWSFALWLIWGAPVLVWGLEAHPPAGVSPPSLVAPGLALIFGCLVSFLGVGAWADRE